MDKLIEKICRKLNYDTEYDLARSLSVLGIISLSLSIANVIVLFICQEIALLSLLFAFFLFLSTSCFVFFMILLMILTFRNS